MATSTNNKARLATVWLGGCAGCHMSLLDLDERIVDVLGLVDLVYSPVADIKKFPDGVDVTLVEGSCCNSENVHLPVNSGREVNWLLPSVTARLREMSRACAIG